MTDDPNPTNAPTDDRRTAVRDRYAAIADADETCCAPACCADDQTDDAVDSNEPEPGRETRSDADPDDRSLEVGYDPSDVEAAPEGANLGLGCGTPVDFADLEPGEAVLDLGAGGGFDCFLAAREVGPEGRVIGVDMTPEMVERARENLRSSDAENVEFRLGEIEHLPVADASVDAIVSNCVVNLSPEKSRVFAEAFRALRPGGRVAISDLVTREHLPDAVREDADAVSACVGGAATVDEVSTMLSEAGFEDVSIVEEGEWDHAYEDERVSIVSARIEARKPA